MLLPVLLVCLALLVQPACLLYTRCVMQAAAAETCRAVSTRAESVERTDGMYEGFALRRLNAVPEVPWFTTGEWTVEVEGSSAAHVARVRIATTARPLPLLGVLPALLGKTDGAGNVVLEVEVARVTRPEWVEGGYGGWAGIWG